MGRSPRRINSIDKYAENPLFQQAMRLWRVKPDAECVTVNLQTGLVKVHVFASDWEHKILLEDVSEKLSISNVMLVAYDIHGSLLRLEELGLHPYLGGTWHPDKFSVLAERGNIHALYSWLKRHKHLKAAEQLKQLFFECFVDVGMLFAPKNT